jgi:hypothetical protein
MNKDIYLFKIYPLRELRGELRSCFQPLFSFNGFFLLCQKDLLIQTYSQTNVERMASKPHTKPSN